MEHIDLDSNMDVAALVRDMLSPEAEVTARRLYEEMNESHPAEPNDEVPPLCLLLQSMSDQELAGAKKLMCGQLVETNNVLRMLMECQQKAAACGAPIVLAPSTMMMIKCHEANLFYACHLFEELDPQGRRV